MVLPSQSARPTVRRSHMFRRRRNSIIKWGIIGAVVIGLPAWLAYSMFGGSGGDPSDAGDTRTVAGETNDGANLTDTPPPVITDPDRRSPSTPPKTGDTTGGVSNPNLLAGPGNTGRPNAGNGSGQRPVPPTGTQGRESDQGGGDAGSRDVSFAELKRVRELFTEGFRLITEDPIRSREYLSRAYTSGLLTKEDENRVRVNLTRMNETLVFSRTVTPGDPFAQSYTIRANDSLSRIVNSRSLLIDHRLLARINGLKNPNSIRAGQPLKLLTGPFHLVVHKSAYRADLFMGDSDDRVYVRSFEVGLGEGNSTPVGTFRVRPDSKLINPEWTNPRTGQRFAADDPANPIGEYWIGLEGIDAVSKTFDSYGIHGTIDPGSIGSQRSMGCIRMRDEDIAMVYEVLIENASVIEIRP